MSILNLFIFKTIVEHYRTFSLGLLLAPVSIRVGVVTIVAVGQPGVGLRVSISGGLSISRPLAIVGIRVAVVSSVSGIAVAIGVIAIAISQPGIGLSISGGLGISSGLSISRPLAIVSVGKAVVGVDMGVAVAI